MNEVLSVQDVLDDIEAYGKKRNAGTVTELDTLALARMLYHLDAVQYAGRCRAIGQSWEADDFKTWKDVVLNESIRAIYFWVDHTDFEILLDEQAFEENVA